MKPNHIIFAISIFAIISCNSNKGEKKIINKSSRLDSIEKYQTDYTKLNSYFLNTDLSLCEYYKSIDTIKKNAKINAEKKYPNELAKHDKYIERYYEQHTQIFRKSYQIADSISFKAYFVGKLFCNE